jgi:hypothetical protein
MHDYSSSVKPERVPMARYGIINGMNIHQKLERTITFLPAEERPDPPFVYWSTRPYHERLLEVFTIVSAGKEKHMELMKDIIEMLTLLNQHQVRYLVVGGYALGLHGHPRYTKDFDIWVERSGLNLNLFHQALADFGIELNEEGKKLFLAGNHFWLGKPPWAIDFIGNPTGIEFEACYAARAETTLEGVTVPFLSKAHFIQNKTAIGRPQDLADVDHINRLGN